MPLFTRTQFVIADGSRARWVRRSDRADDFVTIKELKAAPGEPRGEPDGVVFGSSGQRFNVEEKSDAIAERRARFARTVADEINAQAADGEFDRLALVAPARTLGAIREALSAPAASKLSKTLAKDLTKTPDHQLGAWLRPLELG